MTNRSISSAKYTSYFRKACWICLIFSCFLSINGRASSSKELEATRFGLKGFAQTNVLSVSEWRFDETDGYPESHNRTCYLGNNNAIANITLTQTIDKLQRTFNESLTVSIDHKVLNHYKIEHTAIVTEIFLIIDPDMNKESGVGVKIPINLQLDTIGNHSSGFYFLNPKEEAGLWWTTMALRSEDRIFVGLRFNRKKLVVFSVPTIGSTAAAEALEDCRRR